MSRNINELAEIVLDRVYKMGWQHRSAIGKHHETAAELVAAENRLRETEQELQRLRRVHMESQSEEVAAARSEIATLRQQLDAAQREASDEFAERQVLQHEASDAYVELERLRAFVELARGITPRNGYAGVEMLRAALTKLDAGTTEPTPVAETLDAEGAK
jgi:predicted RNase H-like nuclease (RuvC/YqgF family)